ncbi:hypothetical protein ACQKGO_14185 [Corallococcus interemptor]|uniref:hypothetical protein n=1 Tax=Corallococcus interemptor TaxID=2316720 RepID=UPI003D002688
MKKTHLKQWLSASPLRTYTLQKSKNYWRLRQQVHLLSFNIKKQAYTIRSRTEELRASAGLFSRLALKIARQALLATTIVLLFELIEQGFMEHSTSLQKNYPRLFFVEIDRVFYVSLLSTLLQTYGLFLGLYFATISTVASTAYARVSADVRSVLLEDKLGNIYLQTIAFTATGTALLLAAASLGWKIGVLNLYLSIILAALSILSFRALGSRAFHFFDPTTIAQQLNIELQRWVTSASPLGHNWLDHSFQNHYRKYAERKIKTYGHVIALACQKENASTKTLTDTTITLLRFLSWYANQKPHIPSQSYWFGRVLEHASWFTPNYTSLDIALKTNTALQPSQVPDLSWLESETLPFIHMALASLTSQHDYDSAARLAETIDLTARQLTRTYCYNEALSLISTLRSASRESETEHATHKPTVSFSHQPPNINTIDTFGLSVIEFSIEVRHGIERLDKKFIESLAQSIINKKAHDTYFFRLPRPLLERAERLLAGLAFERAAEKKVVTAEWYICQELATESARFGISAISDAINQSELLLAREAEDRLGGQDHLATCHLASRGLEACFKLRALVSISQSWLNEISSLQKQGDIKWPNPDWESLNKRIDTLSNRLSATLATGASALGNQINKRTPDYLGQAYFNASTACYQAMANGDLSSFHSLLKSYLEIYHAAAASLYASAAKPFELHNSPTTIQPTREAVELSGYAIAYSVLHQKDFWTPLRRAWDDYFSRHKDPADALKFISQVLLHFDAPFTFKPGDMLHTSRRIDFSRRVEQRGWAIDRYSYTFPRDTYSEIPKLFKTLRVGLHSDTGIESVFVAFYLTQYAETFHTSWPRSVVEFVQKILAPSDEPSAGEDSNE